MFGPHLRQGVHDGLAGREQEDVADEVADAADVRGGADEVADVDEAEDVVVRGPLAHGVAGVLQPGDLQLRLLDGSVGREEFDLGARRHDLLDGPVSHREHVDDHLAFVVADLLLAGDERSELGEPHRVLLGLGIASEQPEDDVGRDAEEPYDRAEEGRDGGQGAGDEAGDRLGGLQGDPLGDELSEDDRQVGDGDRHEDEGERRGPRGAHSPFAEDGGHDGRDLGSPEGGREEPRDGHADLDGGEEAIGVLSQPLDGPPRRPPRRHLLDLGLPQRDERHLRSREEPADEGEQHNEQDVLREWIHRSIVAEARTPANEWRRPKL